MEYPKLPVKIGQKLFFFWDGDFASDIISGINVEFRIEKNTISILNGFIWTEYRKVCFRLFPKGADKPYYLSKKKQLASNNYKKHWYK